MNNFGQKLLSAIQYLESQRKGYRYSISIRFDEIKSEVCAAVSGQSYEDKSLPHDFAVVSVDDFDKIPEAILRKSKEMLELEVVRSNEKIAELSAKISALQKATSSLQENIAKCAELSETISLTGD